ncbi:MAG: hypothetical protein F4Y02_17990 [Chloroflexi bacterium]|nr:hypothetical protein [Chloroflexota bacterium]
MSVDRPDLADMARRMRDGHWRVLERIAEHDPAYLCPWDKGGMYRDDRPADVIVCSPLDIDLFTWFKQHEDWTTFGDWDDARCAYPVRVTDAGRAALANRDAYDLEPVHGGLIEPGWTCVPSPQAARSP